MTAASEEIPTEGTSAENPSGQSGDAVVRTWSKLPLWGQVLSLLGVLSLVLGVITGLTATYETVAGLFSSSPRVEFRTDRQLSLADTPVPGQVSEILGFGSRTGPRPAFAYSPTTPFPPTPVLNSFSDLVALQGDERMFVRVTTAQGTKRSDASKWSRQAFAANGDPITLNVYASNNAAGCGRVAATKSNVARNARLRIAVWKSKDGKKHVIRAWISADNATPGWVTDAVVVTTASDRAIELVEAAMFAQAPPELAAKPKLDVESLTRSGGALIGVDGLLGSCWENRVHALLRFRQV